MVVPLDTTERLNTTFCYHFFRRRQRACAALNVPCTSHARVQLIINFAKSTRCTVRVHAHLCTHIFVINWAFGNFPFHFITLYKCLASTYELIM